MSHPFEIRKEVELPGSVEDAWHAVATAAGQAGWMFPPPPEPPGASTEIEEDMPRRFAVRTQHGDWFNALESVIESRNGGSAVLRYVHSGIMVDDWANQLDAANQHTDFYLHTLGQYLAHFPGRTATYIGEPPGGVPGPPESAVPDGFVRVQRAIGLPDRAAEGDAVRLMPAGLDPIEGVVDYRREHFLGVRTEDGLYRFFGRNAFGHPVGMSAHLFGEVGDPAALAAAWRDALTTPFAAGSRS
jgi:hypothetical protein